jgi:hypothetical protein
MLLMESKEAMMWRWLLEMEWNEWKATAAWKDERVRREGFGVVEVDETPPYWQR